MSAIALGDPREHLVERLGDPDEIKVHTQGGGAELQRMMEGVAGGETLIRYGGVERYEEILVYRDPYRPRKQYMFALSGGVVSGLWSEVHGANGS